VAEWWSIEVLHGEFTAFQWQDAHDSELIEAALTNGALDGTWHADRWGVAFEVCFNTAEEWERFRDLPVERLRNQYVLSIEWRGHRKPGLRVEEHAHAPGRKILQ